MKVKDPFVDGGPGNVVVSLEWYLRVMSNSHRLGCPFCSSRNEPTHKAEDDAFKARYGCRDCDNWWTPEQMR